MDNLQPVQGKSAPLEPPISTADQSVESASGYKKSPFASFLLELVQTLVLAVVLYVLIDTVIARVRVENISMRPTLEPGEFLLVNKMAYKLNAMSRGDIIVFHYSPTEDYIKRLIGLPGDVVKVTNGKVSVNDFMLDEPYIAAPPAYNGVWEVPEGAVFVLGDNRNQSSDSHAWGFVTMDKIVGKALAIYWPLKNAHVLSHPNIVKAAVNEGP
ncbi:signal peptidase I [Leptolinea tardivitalis]|uniref:signal peptidase I n=1 Tax=Leptolinea tardivitalis TaxID=229920 RepID=UPI0009D6D376|nr:signal peptidase I [Leptolinea tardivitalis]GAP20017.1 signal peptidase I, bacterial type [Leptolinea tardivitalis]